MSIRQKCDHCKKESPINQSFSEYPRIEYKPYSFSKTGGNNLVKKRDNIMHLCYECYIIFHEAGMKELGFKENSRQN